MGLKDKLNAAMQRVNAGRQAKLAAKSEAAYGQGNIKKGTKLAFKAEKTALRGEKRNAMQSAKSTQKLGKALGNMRGIGEMAQEKSQPMYEKSMAEKRRQFDTPRVEKPMIPQKVTPPPTDANFQNKFQSKSFRDENIEKILKARKQ